MTVNLRIEGPTKTVFEGNVTTDVRSFKFTNAATTYTCDGTEATGGTSSSPVPVRNGALITAAETNGFALLGTFGQYGASFTMAGDQNVDYNADTGAFLIEYLNGAASQASEAALSGSTTGTSCCTATARSVLLRSDFPVRQPRPQADR